MAYNPVARGVGGQGAGGPATGNPNIGGGTSGAGNNDQFSSSNMQPEDYLGKIIIAYKYVERANVNSYLREAVSLLLENRPENPILFLADQ